MRILFINNDGGGFASHIEVAEGTTVAQLFEKQLPGREAGDYLIPAAEGAIGEDHIRAELGEVLVGTHPGRESDDELTLFKSLGLAVEDLASAELIVRRARERGVGAEVEF